MAVSNPRGPVDALRVSDGYPACDGWHDVVVTQDEGGRWQVFDLSDARLVLVETLSGHDDRLDQAQALARDYACEQAAYHAGRRASDPLPRPEILVAPPHAA